MKLIVCYEFVFIFFLFSSRRRHTRFDCDWSSDVCSSDLARSDGGQAGQGMPPGGDALAGQHAEPERERLGARVQRGMTQLLVAGVQPAAGNASLAGIRTVLRVSSRV